MRSTSTPPSPLSAGCPSEGVCRTIRAIAAITPIWPARSRAASSAIPTHTARWSARPTSGTRSFPFTSTEHLPPRGLGRRLYGALLELLRLQGVKTVYGGVTPAERGQRGLHRALGFQLLGIYHHTGFKCGKWHDVGWFERGACPLCRQPAACFARSPAR